MSSVVGWMQEARSAPWHAIPDAERESFPDEIIVCPQLVENCYEISH